MIPALLILLPVASACMSLMAHTARGRRLWIVSGACVTILLGVVSIFGPSTALSLGGTSAPLALVLEMTLVALVLLLARRSDSLLLYAGAAAHALILAVTVFSGAGGAESDFVLDPLAKILTGIVSILGSLIVLYAIGYMQTHERHQAATASGSRIFLFLLLFFLGCMNGLFLSDSFVWLGVFWEATTLCSYFLIRYEGSDKSIRNATLALVINVFGGCALALGALIAEHGGASSLSELSALHLLAPLPLLCIAAFAKAAQFPFQRWLLGAMVAPTPVSALLHSATMVKAGPYLALRILPAFTGHEAFLTVCALYGAVNFVAGAACAISQSDAKKVLAYSTISNLGLMFACAALDEPLAYAAALTILVFHSISKALLFLCTGTVEQAIGSRDIEDMSELLTVMPMTTTFSIISMVSMVLPPFGMLLSKWMAIESAARNPLVLVFLVLGSALSVVFWVKWIGRIELGRSNNAGGPERLSSWMFATMLLLALAVLVGGIFSVPLHERVLDPIAAHVFAATADTRFSWTLLQQMGDFPQWIILSLTGAIFVAWIISVNALRGARPETPYLCGANAPEDGPCSFHGPAGSISQVFVTSLYLRSVFSEQRITVWTDMAGTVLLFALLGLARLI